jgi:ornithine cyclodeaminase
MIGTGALAPHLIAAHATVRPLERVVLWGRDRERADELARRISDLPLEVEVTADLRDGLRRADIVSAATSSREVLVEGRWLAPGAHVDLVGSFAPDMREADLEVFRRGRAVVDTWRALEESGDLIPAMREGILDRDVPDLTTLLRHPERGRRSPEDITIFKTVGTSVADLAVARQLVSHAIAMGAADIETGAFAVTVG